MVAITKSMDTTRLVVDNDGWEHTNGDLLTIHDYSPSGEMLRAHLGSMDAILALRPAQRALFVGRHAYAGQPILLSEFGGVKFVPGTEAQHSWGYCEADSCAAFAGKLRELFDAVRACPLVDGYCYTQLTDVETEQNGLLTYDRTPKLPLETICAILNGRTNEHESCCFRVTALRMPTASAKIRWILVLAIPITPPSFCARSTRMLISRSGTAASAATKRSICSQESNRI